MTANINEEKIILQRLLYKDQPVSKFAKKYMEFVRNVDKANDTEIDLAVRELQADIEVIEFQLLKAELNDYSRVTHQEFLKNKVNELQKEIIATKEDIIALESQLQLETQKKLNKIEYENYAKLIAEYKDSSLMNRTIQRVEDEMRHLKKRLESQEEKINTKQKQLHLLLISLVEFQDLMREEEQQEKNQEMLIEG